MDLFINTPVDFTETLPIVSKHIDVWYIAMTLYKNFIWFLFHGFHIIFQVDQILQPVKGDIFLVDRFTEVAISRWAAYFSLPG